MNRCVVEYIAAARRFEQLARIEVRPEAKQLMQAQAESCIKLAIKRGREVNGADWQTPLPIDWMR
jgi:hypothetical protein